MDLIFQLIRDGEAKTRRELVQKTGLARAKVSQRVDSLTGRGLVQEVGDGASTRGRSTGGRPPATLEFDPSAGIVLVADLGATHCRLAVADLGGDLLDEVAADLAIDSGPDEVLGWVMEAFEDLLGGVDNKSSKFPEVWGIGIGLPGPVDFFEGKVMNPPVMPGWHGVDIKERLEENFPGVPVLVDNDVNIMALGEYRHNYADYDHMLFVKVATGIGCGIVSGGELHRGARGGAGDMGHIRVSGHEEAVCRCGNAACVEAVAAGWALVKQLRELGFEVGNTRDVVAAVEAGNSAASRLVRRAGELIGEVLSGAVSFFNPAVVVIGGDLAHVDEQLLAGVRAVVYQRSMPLATHHLEILSSTLDDRAGVLGAAALVADYAVSRMVTQEGRKGVDTDAEQT